MSCNMDKFGNPIVVDVGTYTTKVGFVGEIKPRAIVRSIMGKKSHRKNGNLETKYFQ